MKAHLFRSINFWLAFSVLVFCGQVLAGAAQSSPAPAATATNLLSVLAEPIPQSVFTIPATPKDGRNPFFPQSAQALPQINKPNSPIDTSALVLNGITPNGPRRTAMINSRTFEAGESGEVRLPSGARMLIKCEEIKNDSVVILIDNQRRELKLRFGL
jgi:hypothetical protein